MKKLMIALSLLPFNSIAQAEIDWAICIQEKQYQYVTPKMDGFQVIKKPFKFCYNTTHFGFADKTGYIQIFPLVRRAYGKTAKGIPYEDFANGETNNFQQGDIYVKIIYSKPQSVFINDTRAITSHAYYLETNQFPITVLKDKK
ncbi:MAG: hypothetical protein WC716_02360 [Chitinophagaceae bacterium]|jgi:hypothetical protein